MRSARGKWSLVIYGGERTLRSSFLGFERHEPYVKRQGNTRKAVSGTEHAQQAARLPPPPLPRPPEVELRNWRPCGKWSLGIRSPGVVTRERGNTRGRRRVLERVSFRVSLAKCVASLLCGVCRRFPGPQMEGPGLRSGLARAGRKLCFEARVRRAEALL